MACKTEGRFHLLTQLLEKDPNRPGMGKPETPTAYSKKVVFEAEVGKIAETDALNVIFPYFYSN